jgi:DNA invertase Pin-like site-specific DNA recombinase
MSYKRILRYVRVSSRYGQKVDRQVEEGDRTKYGFFLEEKVSGKTELFQREKGSIIKELVLEKKIDVVSVYSVDRISRNLKDLLSVIDFLHENGVALQIDNLGITTLVENKVNPSIMIIIQMMGAFSQLETEWRSERQMAGIRKAQEKGIYRNRNHHRRKETQKEFLSKHKNTIDLIEKYPYMKNLELAKLGGVHFNTITKIRKIRGIEKMNKKQGEEYIKGLKNQPIVSSSEFVNLMS